MSTPWTKEIIKQQIQNNQKWLERAIVAIYKKQTLNEQKIEHSIEYNKVGFSGPDSKRLSYYAKWILSGKHLTGEHLITAKEKMLKYSRQLEKIANRKI